MIQISTVFPLGWVKALEILIGPVKSVRTGSLRLLTSSSLATTRGHEFWLYSRALWYLQRRRPSVSAPRPMRLRFSTIDD